ncbi:hypothetical protein [Xenorhabdus stockiae]|uniref:hypothetical protein n=1 Tax=Xenorhabdus stockiae TaxID=351614 RepID=UPI00114561A6|nr:hypothetical protein [Xenorhabdus stockiae]
MNPIILRYKNINAVNIGGINNPAAIIENNILTSVFLTTLNARKPKSNPIGIEIYQNWYNIPIYIAA